MALLSRLFNPRQLPTPEEIGAIPNSERGIANGVATLDGTGKVPASQLSSVYISEPFAVASEAAMLALDAQRGDLAVRSDVGKTFVLAADNAAVLGNWLEVLAQAPVQSVDGETGAVNLESKYLQLTGGTVSGVLSVYSGGNAVRMKVPPGAGVYGALYTSYYANPSDTGQRTAYIGHGSSGNNDFYIVADNGDISLSAGQVLVNGNRVPVVTVSAAAPSGGSDGDVWYQV